jgi:heptosyltransferase-2
MSQSYGAKRRLLVLCVSGIGNAVLQAPLIAALVADDTQEVDILFGNRGIAGVFTNWKSFANRYVLPTSWTARVRLVWDLRRRRYSHTIACFPSNKLGFHLLPFILGVPQRISHSYEAGSLKTLSFLTNRRLPARRELHDVDQNLELLALLDRTVPRGTLENVIRPDPASEHVANTYLTQRSLQGSRYIGIHAGCKASEAYRRWPAANFVDLIKQLNAAGFKCLLFCGPEERAVTHEIYSALPSSGAENFLVESLDIASVAAIIRTCAAFLSTDSGLGHIAAAVGVPVLAIFGPAQWSRTAPYGAHGHHLELRVPCSPCLGYPFESTSSTVRCRFSYRCLTGISADMVYRELMRIC